MYVPVLCQLSTHVTILNCFHGNCTAIYANMNPDSKGPIYCAEQIQIPPELPDILKEFTKAAIRTQPTDLLQWSAA